MGYKLFAGRNYLSWYGSQARLVITEVELVKEILNNKDKVYSKTRPSGFEKKLLGLGVAFSEGEKWERQRKLSHHAFHGENLKACSTKSANNCKKGI